MADAQAVGTYTNETPFYKTQLPESLPIERDFQEFPETLKFRKLSNRFSQRPVLIELSQEELAERFIPASSLKERVDLFSYLDKNDEKLTACKLGIRRCIGCDTNENLHIVRYELGGKHNQEKNNVIFLKKIGGLPDETLPRYFFNHGEGFGSMNDAYCPSCISKIQKREEFRRYMITTA